MACLVSWTYPAVSDCEPHNNALSRHPFLISRDGRLSIVIDKVTNAPVGSDIYVVACVGQSEQCTLLASNSAWRTAEDNVKILRATLHFDLPRSSVQDRATQVVLEVHDKKGPHGSVSMHVWKVARGDGAGQGSFPCRACKIPSRPHLSGQASRTHSLLVPLMLPLHRPITSSFRNALHVQGGSA